MQEMTRLILPSMADRGCRCQRALCCIVNVSSLSAILTVPLMTVYVLPFRHCIFCNTSTQVLRLQVIRYHLFLCSRHRIQRQRVCYVYRTWHCQYRHVLQQAQRHRQPPPSRRCKERARPRWRSHHVFYSVLLPSGMRAAAAPAAQHCSASLADCLCSCRDSVSNLFR